MQTYTKKTEVIHYSTLLRYFSQT